MKKLSLRLRLIVTIFVTIIIAWAIATSITFYQTRESMRELFDTQLMLFSKRIAATNMEGLSVTQTQRLPKVKSKSVKKHMSIEDDALSFAIFSMDGKMLLTDGQGSKNFQFNPMIVRTKGNAIITKDEKWRILWMLSADGQFVVAAGQEMEYVNDIVYDILKEQMLPWLIMLPLLMIGIAFMITLTLKPLKILARELQERKADDSEPIDKARVPKEIHPFIDALNALFIRVNVMLTKERRFTANAAHELRTPLAALKVQAEVAQLADDDVPMRLNALNNLTIGIDRATRLLEQMLILSRLDSLSDLADIETIDWVKLVDSTVHDLSFSAANKHIQLECQQLFPPVPIQGQTAILSLLLRNLVDNAIRYTPEGGKIDIILDRKQLIIRDNGKGVSEEVLQRLGERFYRPPGQEQTGSGLGLSIVRQIADLHRLHIRFDNLTSGGFAVTSSWV